MSMRTLLMSVAALCTGAMVALSATAAVAAPQALRPEAPIEVSAAPKRFDLMTVDKARRRLLVAHSQAGTLTVIDHAADKLEHEVPVGQSSGVAVDPQDGKYFVGTTQGVAVVDRNTLGKIGFISTPGPADAMVFDQNDDRLYVGHDDDGELWVIDPRHDKITGQIAIPGAPELMAIDRQSHRLYVNIKPKNEVVAIDPGLARSSPVGRACRPIRRMGSLSTCLTGVCSSPVAAARSRCSRYRRASRSRASILAPAMSTRSPSMRSPGGCIVRAAGGWSLSRSAPVRTPSSGSVAIPQGTHSVAVDPRTHRVDRICGRGSQLRAGICPRGRREMTSDPTSPVRCAGSRRQPSRGQFRGA
jgi:hypothetical protein